MAFRKGVEAHAKAARGSCPQELVPQIAVREQPYAKRAKDQRVADDARYDGYGE